MTPLTGFVVHPLVHALGWTLLHFCWEGALVAGMLWCVLGLLGGRSSTARYGAACVAMVLLVALPLLTFGRLAATEYQTRSATHRLAVVLNMNVFLRAGEGDASGSWLGRTALMLDHSMPWLLSAWLLGALFFVVRLNFGLVIARRLKSAGIESPCTELLASFETLRQRVGVTRVVRLLHSARVQVPTVVGWLKPVVLIPASCLSGLSAEQIEAILCHELAHVRRHDYLVSVFQSLAEALLFYHPAVWWVSKQVRRERECCCDEVAVANCGDAVTYARALSYLEERRASLPEFVLGANGGVLTMRIKRLLGYRDVPAISPMAVAAICLALTVVAGVYVGGVAHAEPRSAMHVREPLPLIETAAPSTLLIQTQSSEAPKLYASAAPELAASPYPQADDAAPMGSHYRTWLTQDVSWIISPEERAAYLQLANNEERDRFIQQFWDRRDYLAAHGSAREEHYARMAYSNEHFASDRPGWSTDRGHIYIVLGKPDSIDSHPSGNSAVSSLPYEVWHYGHVEGMGDNIDLTFVEVREGGDYRLKLGPNGLFSPGTAPVADGPVRVSDGLMSGNNLTTVDPVYPAIARAAHVTGSVVLHAVISKQGTVENVTLVSGPPMLVESAMQAVKQWTYKPYQLSGQPTAVETTISVNYSFGEAGPYERLVTSNGTEMHVVIPIVNAPVRLSTAYTTHFTLNGGRDKAAMAASLPPAHANAPEGAVAVPGTVTPLVLIHSIEPEYTEQARKAKVMGTVLLNLTVDQQGQPTNVHVVRRIGYGLDQKAVSAVSQYRFKPAMKDGVPVESSINIEVNFKIF